VADSDENVTGPSGSIKFWEFIEKLGTVGFSRMARGQGVRVFLAYFLRPKKNGDSQQDRTA
jgi:hypothetical protein